MESVLYLYTATSESRNGMQLRFSVGDVYRFVTEQIFYINLTVDYCCDIAVEEESIDHTEDDER